ncbi:hypothetical protein ACFV3E_13155 [Streptomyces sp. NPDC059718]
MAYLLTGFLGLLAGARALGLRRRQMGAEAVPSALVILRPAVLGVLGWIALAGGLFLLAGGILVLVQG